MLNHVQGQVWKRVWIFEARSENGCGKWHFLDWNWVWIWRCGRHTPTKNSKEYPLSPPPRASLLPRLQSAECNCRRFIAVKVVFSPFWWIFGALRTHNLNCTVHAKVNNFKTNQDEWLFLSHYPAFQRFLILPQFAFYWAANVAHLFSQSWTVRASSRDVCFFPLSAECLLVVNSCNLQNLSQSSTI